MKKRKLFLDCDNTICNSTKAVCSFYNYFYSDLPSFKPADYTLVKQYNLKDQCPLLPNASKVFDLKEFFTRLELYPNCYDVLKELNEKWELIIVSIGSPTNIGLKAKFIQEHLPFIKKYVLYYNGEGCTMNKDIVNMNIKGNEENVFIDDHSGNLHSSNALIKLCYGIKADWNEDWTGKRVKDWTNFREIMMNI